jgi:hypothetical protein
MWVYGCTPHCELQDVDGKRYWCITHGLQVMMFEEEFALDIPDADAEKIFTAEDAVSYILAHQ